MRLVGLLLGMVALLLAGGARADGVHHVKALKITTLSTMLADRGLGEWGYAALVEVDGRRILFDTGAHADVVLRNAADLGIDLSTVEDVVISHNHSDHTGGLIALRRAMMAKNPATLSRVHVAAGIFEPRLAADGRDQNGLSPLQADVAALGGHFVVHDGPMEIAPGVWFTGPVPRPHAEANWNPGVKLRRAGGLVEDNVPEDAALVFATDDGVVILTGCGHAGIMNLADDARAITGDARLLAVSGGLHLFAQPEAVLAETARRLAGLRYLLAAHCTGIEATLRLRQLLGLNSRTAVVAAVGSSFTVGKGIDALAIAGTP